MDIFRRKKKVQVESKIEPIENENFQSKVYKYSDKYVTVYRRIK